MKMIRFMFSITTPLLCVVMAAAFIGFFFNYYTSFYMISFVAANIVAIQAFIISSSNELSNYVKHHEERLRNKYEPFREYFPGIPPVPSFHARFTTGIKKVSDPLPIKTVAYTVRVLLVVISGFGDIFSITVPQNKYVLYITTISLVVEPIISTYYAKFKDEVNLAVCKFEDAMYRYITKELFYLLRHYCDNIDTE